MKNRKITYKNSITADEINSLRASVGFRQIDQEQLNAGLEGSKFVTAAYDNDKAVGMARLIWDGGGVALLTDVIVSPEYQSQSIEKELVEQALDYLRGKLRPGFGIQVDVRAWERQELIYQDLGFEVSTQERRGTPMQICLTDQIELTDARFGQCGFAKKENKTMGGMY